MHRHDTNDVFTLRRLNALHDMQEARPNAISPDSSGHGIGGKASYPIRNRHAEVACSAKSVEMWCQLFVT